MSVNMLTLVDHFNTDDKCRELLEDLRWPDSVACLRCGSAEVSEIAERSKWNCLDCGYHFSVTAGTIMHDSHLPLRKWFIAIYLMCESKKGISAKQLERTLNVAYKTAWYLCHRIREAMANDPFDGPTLFGVVEVDETLVGGKTKGKGRGYRGNKTWVVGAVQRDGGVRLERIPNVKRATLHDFINRTVRDETEAIYTMNSSPTSVLRMTTLDMRRLTTQWRNGWLETYTQIRLRASGRCSSVRSLELSTR